MEDNILSEKEKGRPTRTENYKIWAEKVGVAESVFKQMITAGVAYVVAEKDKNDNTVVSKIYRKSDGALIGFIDRDGIENWLNREADN